MIGALDRLTVRRLGLTLSANAYGQVVTIAVQVALVPLLLRAWGTEVYGAWLLLSAVPFYLTLSDFGFTFVAKNVMVMEVAAGRRTAALGTFQSVFALLCLVLPVLMLASVVVILKVPLPAALGAVAPGAARRVLVLLVGNVLLYQFFLLVCAGIRAENRPAHEASWAASARLGEGVAVALAALAGGGPAAAAAAMVACRVAFVAAGYRWLQSEAAWLRLGFAHASRAEVRRLAGPALAYMALPLGQALLLQGPVIVVGGALGAVAVVAFSTARMVARLGTALVNMINNSVVSEYSALAGAGDAAGFARLLRAQTAVTATAIAAYAAGVLAFGPLVLPWLTHGAVRATWPFFAIVVLGVAAEMTWSALFTPLAAVNRHRGVAAWFALVALGGVAGCWLIAPWLGASGVAGAVLAAHLAMAMLCAMAVRRG